MRTIKFRAWVDEYEELLPVLSIDFVNDFFCVLPEAELEGGNQVAIKGLEKLEKFTGLYDRHGVEICEGDVVVWRVNGHSRIGPIVFDSGCFCLGKDGEGFEICNDWLRGEYEVVGNIHDNPELLGGGE